MTIDKVVNKLRWGDIEEEDDMDFVDGSNMEGNAIKTAIEYECNNDGNKVSKRAVEKRLWPKFGDAVHEDDGARLTMVSTEEIFHEKPPSGNTMTQLEKGGAVLMVCRTCGNKGDHWTSKCPYKDLVPEDDMAQGQAALGVGAYVPPGMRGGAAKRQYGSEENSVHVTNLSENTRKHDLEELFNKSGQVSRVSVPVDPKTGLSKGFGYVNFVKKEDAERAIAKLNGYRYDHLILRVEWATPRAN